MTLPFVINLAAICGGAFIALCVNHLFGDEVDSRPLQLLGLLVVLLASFAYVVSQSLDCSTTRRPRGVTFPQETPCRP